MSSQKFNVDQFASTAFGHSVQATRAVNGLPENEDFSDAALTNPWFEPQLDSIGKRLVDLMVRTRRSLSNEPKSFFFKKKKKKKKKKLF
jgi:hypothetical protein